MSDNLTAPIEYVNNNLDKNMEILQDLLGIQSISTDSRYLPEVTKCAEWLAGYLENQGMNNIQVLPTFEGHPVVYAESFEAGELAPTMLVYGHYDVQPADPIEAWESNPFEAVVRGDRLYARGSSDMKGQLMAVLIALEAVRNTVGLPLNLKFLLEGQEEIGSRNFPKFIEENGNLFKSDFSLNPDAGMWALDRPAITYGLRGLVDFELRFHGPDKDLHSGLFGGMVHNPAQAMGELIAGLHDPDGRVTMDGFYDKVRAIPEDEKQKMAELGRDENWFMGETGVPALWGEPDFTPFERMSVRPTLEVNGIVSGYTGEGTKTVIPSTAMAKFSLRLVPYQEPEEIAALFRAYLEENIPKTIRWELINFSYGFPALTNLNSFYTKAMDEALTETWGVPTVFPLSGGTIAAVPVLQQALGIESILTGYNLPEDLVHSPNESLHLPTWKKGIESLIVFFNKFRNYTKSG